MLPSIAGVPISTKMASLVTLIQMPMRIPALPFSEALISNWVLILVSFVVLFWVVPLCSRCVDLLWWKPKRLAATLRKQGLTGPPPRILLGNVMEIKKLREAVPDALDSFRHDQIVQHVLPDNVLWSKMYGKQHVVWWGPDPNIVTTDMDMLKEILSSKHTLSLGKPSLLQRFLEPVTGIGLVLANGETWAHERRVIGPAFHFEKIKAFAEVMVRITQEMGEEWDTKLMDSNGTAEIEVEGCMTKLAADIIAHTQFGSSYKRGRKIFQYIDDLKEFVYKHGHLLILPGIRFLPIPTFLELRRMKRTVEMSIREIIEDRKLSVQHGKTASYGADLLGLMLAESEKDSKDKQQPLLSMQQLVDECKTFLFAGHETTAELLIWALLLLAHNTSWQEKARVEVASVCKGKLPDCDLIGKMKIVDMILHETLRLYAPANSIVRTALCDMTVGNLFVPKGTCFWIPIMAIHLDPELWGEDVYEFKPERFADGISKAAKHPMAYLPFAHGPRNCIGQTFALVEAKLVLASLLLRYRFRSSPSYRHSPQIVITVRPKYGAPIIVEKL